MFLVKIAEMLTQAPSLFKQFDFRAIFQPIKIKDWITVFARPCLFYCTKQVL